MEKIIKNQINVIIFFGLMLGIPFLMQVNPFGISTYLKKLVGIGTSGEWLGFWGSYLGSIITVLFSYFSIMYKTKKETKNAKSKLARETDKEKINLIKSRVTISESEKLCFIYEVQFIDDFNKNFKKNGGYDVLLALCDQLVIAMNEAITYNNRLADNVLTSIYEENKIYEENINEIAEIEGSILKVSSAANEIKNLIGLSGMYTFQDEEKVNKEVEKIYDGLKVHYKKGNDASLKYTKSVLEYYKGLAKDYRKEYLN